MPANPSKNIRKPRPPRATQHGVQGRLNQRDNGKFDADRPMVQKATKKASQRKPPRKLSPSATDPTKPYNKSYAFGEINPNAPTPETRTKKNAPICGANRTGKSQSGPGICCQTAGWGTAHPGYGHCRAHGGNLPGPSMAAEKEMRAAIAAKALNTYGLPKDVDPQTALLQEVQRTAGHVDWLEDLVHNLESQDALKQYTEAGIAPAVWISMLVDERKHLVNAASAAIKCGVAERQVRIAEEQGRLLAMVLQAFMRDSELGLSPQQMVIAPKLIRKHLQQAPMALEKVEDGQTTQVKPSEVIDV